MGSPSPFSAHTCAIGIHQWSAVTHIRLIPIHTVTTTNQRGSSWIFKHYYWILTMGASDRARTETRAFLIVASADWSIVLGGLNLEALFWTQPCVSDSGLSSLPAPFPFSWWFWGDPERSRVLSSDEDWDGSSVSAVAVGPRSMNCLGTTAPATSCFFSSDFPPTDWTHRNKTMRIIDNYNKINHRSWLNIN